jgi:hypothetical protein
MCVRRHLARSKLFCPTGSIFSSRFIFHILYQDSHSFVKPATRQRVSMRYAPAYPNRALLRAFSSEKGGLHTRLEARQRVKIRYAPAYPKRTLPRAFSLKRAVGIRGWKRCLLCLFKNLGAFFASQKTGLYGGSAA